MKKIILSLIISFTVLGAYSQSYNTIAIDGINSGWAATETFTNCSSADNAYITWDADYIYIGISDVEADYDNVATFVYFDIDPTGTNGNTSSYIWDNSVITAPFKCDYVVVWKNGGDGDYIEVRDYNDGTTLWNQIIEEKSSNYNNGDIKFSVGTDYREIKIKRSILGSPTSLKTFMLTEQQWGSYWRYFAWPSNGWTDQARATGQSIPNNYGFILMNGISPNSSNYYNASFKNFDNGSGNALWGTSSNWTDDILPSSTDLVTITSGNTVTIADDGTSNTDAITYDLAIEAGAQLSHGTNSSHIIYGSINIWGTDWINDGSFYTVTGSMVIWPSADLTIYGGGQLTIEGATRNFGDGTNFTIKSILNKTGSFIPIGATSGYATVERYITEDIWHYISAPVADARLFNATGFLDLTSGAGNDQLYYWDESATISGIGTGIWYDILNGSTGVTYSTGSFNTSQGYAITKKGANKTISFIGTPFYSSQTINIYYTSGSSNPGANLLGNPFSSTIAVNSNAQTANNIIDINSSILNASAQAIYLWEESISDYTIINNYSSATFIEPGQGFMVVAKTGGGSFNFNPDIRKHGTTTFYKSTKSDQVGVELLVTDSHNRTNNTQIAFMENMTFGLDPSFDGMKLKGNPDIALYTRLVEDNGVDFAIQALPVDNIEAITIPVGIDVIEATTCEFSVKPDVMEDYPIYLQDIQENTVTNLKENSYSTLVTESGTGRFFLHFRDISGIGDNKPLENINIFASNNKIEIRNNKPINATINIYNIAGQLITTSQLNNESGASVVVPNYKGIAIVSVTSSGQTINNKVIVW